MIAASDQGAVVTLNSGADTPEWSSWLNQPTAQVDHIAIDSRFPYWVTGAQQDSGAVQVHTRSQDAGITMRDWIPLCAGGEAGYTAPDPLNPGIVYGGTVERCNVETGQTWNVTPERNMPEPARHAWTQPLVFSKADPHALYFANQFLYKTSDGGEHWTQISPDLTREDPLRKGLLFAGTERTVHVSFDDGDAWQSLKLNLPPSSMRDLAVHDNVLIVGQPESAATANVSAPWRPPAPALNASAGMHRFVWDLRGTPPAGRERGGAGEGGGGRGGAPMSPPASYTVRLTVDGTTLTQPLTVKKDPRVS